MTIELNEQWIGVAALLTILLGMRINRAVQVFTTYSVPPAVTGGLLIALLLAVAGATLQWKVIFAETLRNALLLRECTDCAGPADAARPLRRVSRRWREYSRTRGVGTGRKG